MADTRVSLHLDSFAQDWRVLSVAGTEPLGRPFRFDVVLSSLNPDLDIASMLGQRATLSIAECHGTDRSAARRVVCGWLSEVEQGDEGPQGCYRYRVSLLADVARLVGGHQFGFAPCERYTLDQLTQQLRAVTKADVELRLSSGGGGIHTAGASLAGQLDDLDAFTAILREQRLAMVFAASGDTVLLIDSVDGLPLVDNGLVTAAALGEVQCGVGRVAALGYDGNMLSASSRSFQLSAGQRFSLFEHPDAAMNREWVVSAVEHHIEARSEDDIGSGYHCIIEAVDAAALDAVLAQGRIGRLRSIHSLQPLIEVPANAARFIERSANANASSALPLAAHLGTHDAFSEQDDSDGGVGTWARISVAAQSPKGYLRLGATVADETSFQSAVAMTDWISSWPFTKKTGTTSEVNVTFAGVFLYSDRHVLHGSGPTTASPGFDFFDYAGRDYLQHVAQDSLQHVGRSRYERVVTKRTVTIGDTTTSAVSDGRGIDRNGTNDFKPPDETNLVLPSFITNLNFTDQVDVNGSSTLTVEDLFVEEVAGDRALYIKGDDYRFVRGDYRLVVDGADDNIHQGNVDDKIRGDRSSTVNGNTTNTVGAPGNTGHAWNWTYGARVSITMGTATNVRLGFQGSLDVGMRIAITLGIYFRGIMWRFSVFGFKGDWCHTKYDAGMFKWGAYAPGNNKKTAVYVGMSTLGIVNLTLAAWNHTVGAKWQNLVYNL